MGSQFGQYHRHSGKLVCPRCGKTGAISREDAPSASGEHAELVKIDGDFYERIAKHPPYPIELVCNSCGAPQPGPVQS